MEENKSIQQQLDQIILGLHYISSLLSLQLKSNGTFQVPEADQSILQQLRQINPIWNRPVDNPGIAPNINSFNSNQPAYNVRTHNPFSMITSLPGALNRAMELASRFVDNIDNPKLSKKLMYDALMNDLKGITGFIANNLQLVLATNRTITDSDIIDTFSNYAKKAGWFNNQ